MARTAFTAPAHIVPQRNPVGNTQIQPDSAPSLTYAGGGLLDHRMQWNRYNGAGWGSLAAAVGFATDGTITALKSASIAAVPAAGTGGIAAAANVVINVPMTLTTATTLTNGALITPSAIYTYPFATLIPAGTVVIQNQIAYYTLGLRDKTAFYDADTLWARAIAVTGVTAGTGGAFTVRGYDIYGQPMTETITATAGATTVAGKKAWKWITSITPGFTDAHNYSFDVINVFGLPVAADVVPYVQYFLAGANTAITTFVAADTTAVSGVTGDVRGTIAIAPSAQAVVVFQTVPEERITATPTPSIFGLTNYTA